MLDASIISTISKRLERCFPHLLTDLRLNLNSKFIDDFLKRLRKQNSFTSTTFSLGKALWPKRWIHLQEITNSPCIISLITRSVTHTSKFFITQLVIYDQCCLHNCALSVIMLCSASPWLIFRRSRFFIVHNVLINIFQKIKKDYQINATVCQLAHSNNRASTVHRK